MKIAKNWHEILEKDEKEMESALKRYEAKKEIHQLIKRVAKVTKLGRCHSSYDDSWGLDIGGGELWSCFRFEQLSFSPILARDEYDVDEIGIDDEEMIQELLKEIKNRYECFKTKKIKSSREYLKRKKKFAMKFFNHSIKHILNMYD